MSRSLVARGAVALAFVSAGLVAAAGGWAQTEPASRLLASSSVNGRTFRVFSVGGGSPRVVLSQVDATARISFGTHAIVVAADGTVTVDGETRSQGAFRGLDVTIGDGERIDLKVVR